MTGGIILTIEKGNYDLSYLARCNYHIHTSFSECASSEMTLESIVSRAESLQLETIAIVDHHHCWTKGMEENLCNLKNKLSSIKTDIKVLIGAELSAYGIGKYSDSIELNKMADYRLYACNHYHLNFWEHPSNQTYRGYAEHSLAVMSELIKSGRADCIAHPFMGYYLKDRLSDPTLITGAITDNELKDILQLGRDNNVAWEINDKALLYDPNFAKRYWSIGKEVGVTFNFGTDAHWLINIDTHQSMDELESLINS